MKLRLEQVHDYGATDIFESSEYAPVISYEGPVPPGVGLVFDYPERTGRGLAFIDGTSEGDFTSLTPGLRLIALDGPSLALNIEMPLQGLGLFAIPAFTRVRVVNLSTLTQHVRLFIF